MSHRSFPFMKLLILLLAFAAATVVVNGNDDTPLPSEQPSAHPTQTPTTNAPTQHPTTLPNTLNPPGHPDGGGGPANPHTHNHGHGLFHLPPHQQTLLALIALAACVSFFAYRYKQALLPDGMFATRNTNQLQACEVHYVRPYYPADHQFNPTIPTVIQYQGLSSDRSR